MTAVVTPNPQEWLVRSMMDLVELPTGQVDPRLEPYSSQVLVAPDHMEGRTGRLLNRATAKSQNAISGKYAFSSGDVLYSKIRPYLRKAVLANFDGLCSADVYPLRPRQDVHPSYLLALVLSESFSTFAESVSMRSGFPKINRTELAEYRTAVPPFEEQARIAEVLDTLDEAILCGQELIGKLTLTGEGFLRDLVTKGLDHNGEVRTSWSRHPSPNLLPQSWTSERVEEVGSVVLGRQRAPKYEKGPTIRPYLRVANVFDGWIDFSDILCMNFSPSEQVQYQLLPGDILLNEGQSLELVGRSTIYEGEPGAFCFQNTLVRFRCFPQKMIPLFARMLFKYWLDTGRFMTIAKQTTSVAHLGAGRFAKMSISVPPLEEQAAITARFQTFTDRLKEEKENVAKLRLLKSGLSLDLLTGRVRVTTGTPA